MMLSLRRLLLPIVLAASLGMIGAAFGIGFIIGPALGGILSNWGLAASAFAAIGLSRYAVPAFVAVGLAALNLLGIIFWLPESLPREKREQLAEHPRTAFTISCLWNCLNRPRFGTLLNARFFYMLGFTTFTANFALYAQYRLRLTDQATSYVLAYVGVLVVLVQGLAIGRLTARFREPRLIFGGVCLLAVTLLAWALVPNVPLLVVVLAPLALASGVLNTVTNSAMTKAVYHEEVGGALGLSSSLDSLTRVIAPGLGGFLLQRWGGGALGVFGALVVSWVALYVWRRLVVHPAPPLVIREEVGVPSQSGER